MELTAAERDELILARAVCRAAYAVLYEGGARIASLPGGQALQDTVTAWQDWRRGHYGIGTASLSPNMGAGAAPPTKGG